MTRVEELKKTIEELRESGAEPEDIAQVVQELNMEMAKAITPVPIETTNKGGGKGVRKRKKETKSND